MEFKDLQKVWNEEKNQVMYVFDQEAINRMTEEARRYGADAIINVRFTTSAVMQGMSEMLAYGTAVKTQAQPPEVS